ncbi:polysaccharide deacetylase family protein [Frateuria hangzhouensis]|uniref:polysaccharide deacetylase family protein n=1 Tax=Frateuria hangzhouensis TaxID=2995589 RepID=UPI002260E659|nr:polysaccharide deacetylase family protein [Frateuria sp. STR12]MCX7514603.1 polysaccharide deacetylase family protein [Frateuria sp. STR12]
MTTETANGSDQVALQRPGKRQRLAAFCSAVGVLPGLTTLRRVLRKDLRILAYHRVLDVGNPDAFAFDLNEISASPDQFREQMLLVKRYYDPIGFHQLIAALDSGRPLPPKPLIVTFDDGYDDNYHVAFPILRELGMSAMFFVSTGHIDSGMPYAYDWLVHMLCRTQVERLQVDELAFDQAMPATLAGRRALGKELLFHLKALDAITQAAVIARLGEAWGMRPDRHAQCRPMTWDQLREMRAAGMEVGSHGVHHHILAKLSPADMVTEIDQSMRTLQREIGAPIEVLSYPVGGPDSYNPQVIEAARRAGFRMACNYVTGLNRLPATSHYGLQRLSVESDMDIDWFAAMTSLPEVFAHPKRVRAG